MKNGATRSTSIPFCRALHPTSPHGKHGTAQHRTPPHRIRTAQHSTEHHRGRYGSKNQDMAKQVFVSYKAAEPKEEGRNTTEPPEERIPARFVIVADHGIYSMHVAILHETPGVCIVSPEGYVSTPIMPCR